MTEKVECAVIGAGVVGLAIARRLAMSGREVVVLEAEEAFGIRHRVARAHLFARHGRPRRRFAGRRVRRANGARAIISRYRT
jgi:glycine/D-amino acid oxidase-like deaminating enzyme